MKIDKEIEEKGYNVYLDWNRIMEVVTSITTLTMQYISIPFALISPVISLFAWDVKPMIGAAGICACNYLIVKYLEWLNKFNKGGKV